MKSCCTERTSLKGSILRFIKPGIFAVAICATIVLFTIPIVFYYVTLYAGRDTSTGEPDIDSNSSNSTSSDCSSSSWAAIEAVVVNCEPYAGKICLPYLTQWNQCLVPGQNETVNIAVYNETGKTQTELDGDLSQLESVLERGGYRDCQAVMIPLLCHYYFPIITTTDCQSDTTAQLMYTATQEECASIRDGVCEVPWRLAINGSYKELPECSLLPFKNSDNTTNSNDSNSSIPVQLTCKSDFISINGTCFPRCDLFKETPSEVIDVIMGAQLVSPLFALFVSIVAFSMSLYYRKKMFAFPAYFLLFFVFDVLIISLLYLIGAINRPKLFCSSINLNETIDNPTFYCTFCGAVYHYMVASMGIWWFLHFCVTYYDIMFPFSSRKMETLGRKKYLAIVLTILGFLLPLPAVITSLSSNKYGYTFTRFPPDLCTPNGTVWFYSCIFPFIIMLCFCVCFLISILWVSQKYQPSSSCASAICHLPTTHKKIVLIALHFIIFGVFVFTHVGISFANEDKIRQEFDVYFQCESTGYTPGKCDRSSFEQYLYPHLSVINYILMGMFPIAILNFIVNWNELWKSIKHQCSTRAASCKLLKKKRKEHNGGGYANHMQTSQVILSQTHTSSADSSSTSVT